MGIFPQERKAPRHGPRFDTSARRDPGHGVVTTRKLKRRSESFTGHCLWLMGCFGFWSNTQPRPFQTEHAGGRTFLKKTLPTSFDTWIDWIKIWNWLKPFPNHSKSYMGAIPHVIPNHRKVEQRLRLEAEDALAEVRRESHDSWKEVM